MPSGISPVKVIAVDCSTDLSGQEVIETVRKALAKEKGTVLVVFPENVLGDKAITRQQGKEIALKISNMLRKRKNAYAFVSFVESAIDYKRRPYVASAGYIVGPWKQKPYWGVYQKRWSKDSTIQNIFGKSKLTRNSEIQKSDQLIIQKNSNLSPKQIIKLINIWGERAKRKTPYPVARIAGRDFQLRLCADISNQSQRYTHDKRKVDFIVVPADGLIEHESAAIAAKEAHNRAVIIVDKLKGISYHPKNGGRKLIVNPQDTVHDKFGRIKVKKIWPVRRNNRR